MDINSNAPALAQHQIIIQASIDSVWKLLSDIDRWPTWHPAITSCRLDGPLVPGTEFRWRSGRTPVKSILQEVVPQQRLSWTGKAMGAKAVHVWKLELLKNTVIVKTEESFEGWIVTLLKRTMQNTLDQSLQAWLLHLKQAAELSK